MENRKSVKQKASKNKSPLMKKIWQNVKDNKLILALFFLSTAFFIHQHALFISWDFSAYVLNGQYWFSSGQYFEILRPPLMPFILGIFSFAGWKASEFIFIIFVSALFAYSSARLAKSLRFNPAGFYALSLSFYLLAYGLINGTELLCLVFLELFLAFMIEDSYFSGLFLGLSALSRYSSLALFPLVLLHLKFKQILKSLILFGAVLSVWFAYNFHQTGNLFTSLADQYANNVLYRTHLIENVQLIDFIKAQNILIPFFILGFVLVMWKLFATAKPAKKFSFKGFRFDSILEFAEKSKIELAMLILLVHAILSYADIPVKNDRYLFSLVLPTVYFSYVGINYLIQKIRAGRKVIALALTITALFVILCSMILSNRIDIAETPSTQVYVPAIDKINSLGLSNCSIESNSWVYLNYFGLPSGPPPKYELIAEHIGNGRIIIFFKHESEPAYVHSESFIGSLPVIYNTEDYVIIGSGKCAPQSAFEESYLEQTDNIIYALHGYHINHNPCLILFYNFGLAEKTCNFINFKEFKQDEYRRIE